MSSKDVYIIGYGITKFSEHYDQYPSNLAADALNKAIELAKIEKEDIQSLVFGSLVSATNSQSSIGLSCSRECNLSVPAVRIEGGNASGAAAFHQAYLSVKSGVYDCIGVVGIEKLSDYVKTGMIEKILGPTIDYHWEYEMGATLTSLYAILTRTHMNEYNTTLEQLAYIPAKNHKNGVNNPNAQFQREIPIEKFLNAKRISDPIGKFDPATFCDGGASVILASGEFISRLKENEVRIPVLSSTHAADRIALHHRDSLSTLLATQKAAKKAYDASGITSSQIDVAEVHDSYPIGEILAIEDLGFFKKGEGGKASEEGKTQINSQISINPSGGLKARGDPFGATGIAQVIEIVEQLTERAKRRQVDDSKYGLTQNVLGTGAMVYVNVLSKEEVKK
ncbi:MAG: thiolase C-terminal domain-containing protein [Candidatus Heimdallarchaeaceae archaeon]